VKLLPGLHARSSEKGFRNLFQANWPLPPPGHATSGAVRTGECHHEMPGSRLRRDKLPYTAFRRVNAEPGGGKPSTYGRRPCGYRGSWKQDSGLLVDGVGGLSYTGPHAGNPYTSSRRGPPTATGAFTGPRAGANCGRGADRDGPTPGGPLGKHSDIREFSCLAPGIAPGHRTPSRPRE